jgi:Uma2 family endonuclease
MSTSTTAKISHTPLNYDDYLTFPDNDRIRKEIIDGELFMSPSPSTKHQSILRNLSFILFNFVKKNSLGEIFFAPFDIILSHINVVQPDIIFLSKQSYHLLTELNLQGAPELVIEILSPSTTKTDRIFKKDIYERFGVKEFWIVDPEKETVEIWQLKNQQFQLSFTFHKDQVLSSSMFKGLEIDLAEVFQF